MNMITQNAVTDSSALNNNPYEEEGHYYWRKNCPYLYDVMLSYTLEWPTLTLDWLPNSYKSQDGSYSVHKIVYGTHTSNQDPNYLVIAELHLGDLESNNDLMNNESFAEYNYNPENSNMNSVQFEVKAKLNHPGEVNKALHMPGHPFIITTRTIYGDILVFDYSKHESFPTDELCHPQLILKGHKSEGYAMDWRCDTEFRESKNGCENSNASGNFLISGGSDSVICLWDFNGETTSMLNSNARNNSVYTPLARTEDDELTKPELSPPVLEPLRNYHWHKSVVNDLKWHPSCRYAFSSVSDDCCFAFWDTRSSENTKAGAKPALYKETSSCINCFSFNEFFPTLFATGNVDGVISIWDSRHTRESIYELDRHSGKPILNLEWSRWTPNILSSGGADGKVVIWDLLDDVGNRETDENVDLQNSSGEEGNTCNSHSSSKAIFIHYGHTAPITGLTWNPNEHGDSLLIASSSEDNTIQFWQLADLHLRRQS